MASGSSISSKKKYATVFNKCYTEDFPCITPSSKGNTYAFCTLCNVSFLISHRGRGDIVTHIKRDKHQTAEKSVGENKKIDFLKRKDYFSVIRAECLFTAFLVEHNLPIATADHVAPLFRKMFPDSVIAKKYGCARTKSTAIIGEMSKSKKQTIVDAIKINPFSISTDGSNKGDKKLYPIVVTFNNAEKKQIETSLLSVPILEGDSTGENIAQLILNTLKVFNIPLENCLALGVDNAPVMVGKRAGVAAFLLKEMPHLFVQGCLCHLIDLAAEKGASCLPVSIEEYLIDIYYYLDKSCKRKDNLKKLQVMFDKEERKILKHVSTRWLSLGRCLRRLLEQWEPLASFFKDEIHSKLQTTKSSSQLHDFKIPKLNRDASNNEAKKLSDILGKKSSNVASAAAAKKRKVTCVNNTDEDSEKKNLSREERLFMFLSSDVNKAYVNFLLNTLPLFEVPNVVLQASKPKIHVLRQLIFDMFKRLLSRFVNPDCIKATANVLDVDYHALENQKSDSELVVGQAALNIIDHFSERKRVQFCTTVRYYYVRVCDYIRNKFPFNDTVLINAEVADLDNIMKASFASIRYFIKRFPVLLKILGNDDENLLLDSLQTQFCSLQVDELPDSIKLEERMDRKWIKLSDFSTEKYGLLSKFMLSILTLPHSNAECERTFSFVTKTCTQFRSQLSCQTLENLLTVKSNMTKSCFEQEFDNAFLLKAKSATAVANSSSSSV